MPVSVEVLRACPLFSGFTDTGLAIIAEIGRPRDLPQGMSLFLPGAAGDSLFIVEAGSLEVFVGLGASAKVLCTLDPGGHLGEMALLRPGKRITGARAKAACKLVELRRADFNDTLKTRPQACMKLMLNIFSTIEKRLEAVQPDLLSLV